MTLALVAGARPNFMKIAPLARAAAARGGLRTRIIHTGQHYDDAMSRVFFDDLDLPRPDVNLGVGSASHGVQTGRVMAALEPVLASDRPDWVLVVGDVNSTLAAALVAVKLGIPTAHVEAGLRSGDRRMPEEINRLATDAVADLLLAPSRDAVDNLRREGHPGERIALVGNVMVDSLLHVLPRLDPEGVCRGLGLAEEFVLVTLHRPSNVDDPARLAGLLRALAALAAEVSVVFPVHPRTRPLLDAALPAGERPAGLRLLPPCSYREFIALESRARLVITDSGGVQEETTVLGVPCLTVRDTTERPVTVREGTNRLVGGDPRRLLAAARLALGRPRPPAHRPEGWDGRASERILDRLACTAADAAPRRAGRLPAGAHG